MNSFKSFFIIVLTGFLSILALACYLYLLITPTLPSINSLTEYRPKEPLQVYTIEGDLIAQFGE